MKKVEGNIAKHEAAKKQAGKKRHSYTSVYKPNVINMIRDGFSQDEVAEQYRISQSQVSRWMKKEKGTSLYKAMRSDIYIYHCYIQSYNYTYLIQD